MRIFTALKAGTCFLAITFLIPFNSLKAQQTGIWDHNFNFKGGQNHITFNVPSNYNPSKTYKLIIVLMGQGYTTQQYVADIPGFGVGYYIKPGFGDVIIAAPGEGTDKSSYFFPPGEDDGIYDATVAEAKSLYNISDVYLQGFSFGAHSAMIEAMNNPTKYKGAMIFADSPGGLPDTNAIKQVYNNFQGINNIPLCLGAGKNDQITHNVSIWLAVKLHEASGKQWVYFKDTGGFETLDHRPPPEVEALGCWNLINNYPLVLSDEGAEEGVTEEEALEEEQKEEVSMILYPNPTKGILHAGILTDEESTLHIYDLTGKLVKEEKITAAGVYNYDLSTLTKGIYNVILTNEKSVSSQKIVLTE